MATGRIGTTPVLTTRWSKAPAAGTTSLSGLDDNSVSLVYSVGYEAVYQNGVLLSRGNDYTATNGTTITLTTATVAGDIIEVFANQTIPLTDTYSQTVANSLFVNQATFDAKGDLIAGTADNTYSRLAVGANNTVLTADSSTSTGLKWATPTSVGLVRITGTTFSAVSSVSLPNSTFTATYVNYLVVFNLDSLGGTPAGIYLRMRASGSDNTASSYFGAGWRVPYTGSAAIQNQTNGANTVQIAGAGDPNIFYMNVSNPQLALRTGIQIDYTDTESAERVTGFAEHLSTTQFDSMTIYPNSGTMTGRYDVYGYTNS